MKNMELQQKTQRCLPLGQLVKMTAPIFVFGVILPFVDMVTDLRMIIRLFEGVPACSKDASSYRNCVYSNNFTAYCQDNPGDCGSESHQIFASMLLGR